MNMWLKCRLCVLFLFTTFTAYGFEDLYLYETDEADVVSHLSIELLNSKLSNLHKREINKKTIADNQSNPKVPDPPLPTTPVINIVNNINNTVVPSDVFKNSMSVLNHNLDVNGTGIRKFNESTTATNNITTTTIPLLTVIKPNNSVIIVKYNQTDQDDDEISESANEEGTALFNQGLEENNINETRTDAHMYYNSSFIIDSAASHHYWVEMENRTYVIVSKSHREASAIRLSFNFPIYGHIIRNITIATGGVLYTGEYVHSWLVATQYIAPLMANFDTSLSNDSFIRYVDNGTSFTVEWNKVSLQDRPNDGQFTFQTTLYDTGDIVFVYKEVPLIIENIQDNHHPVKVGLSDGYIIERTIFYVRRKTIYEFHRVNFKKEDITNATVIYFKALPTSLDHKDCDICLTH